MGALCGPSLSLEVVCYLPAGHERRVWGGGGKGGHRSTTHTPPPPWRSSPCVGHARAVVSVLSCRALLMRVCLSRGVRQRQGGRRAKELRHAAGWCGVVCGKGPHVDAHCARHGGKRVFLPGISPLFLFFSCFSCARIPRAFFFFFLLFFPLGPFPFSHSSYFHPYFLFSFVGNGLDSGV